MLELQELLEKPQADYKDWFKKIAHLLLENYVIEAGDIKYRLLEIEFYYYNEAHKDETTYGYAKDWATMHEKEKLSRVYRHKKAQRNQLTWFIHYSGIDITIGDGANPGGILIRAIQDIKTGETIKGPLVVLLELMNQKMSIDGSGIFRLNLVKQTVIFIKDERIEQQKRIGINAGNYKDEEYNFFVSPLIKRTLPPSVNKLMEGLRR